MYFDILLRISLINLGDNWNGTYIHIILLTRGLLPQGDSTAGSLAQDASNSTGKLKPGCSVRLKDGPKYGGGTIVFRHHPQYGPQVCVYVCVYLCVHIYMYMCAYSGICII